MPDATLTEEQIKQLFANLDTGHTTGIQPTNQDMSQSNVAANQAKLNSEGNMKVYATVGDRLSPSQWQEVMSAINNYAYRTSAAGSFDHQYQQVFTRFDKYGYNPIVRNTVLSGYTFITRPKLNLSPGAVASHDTLGLLMTTAPNSPMYAIRCMLDTKYCQDHRDDASRCKMVDLKSPFINLLTNCSRSNSGWQDFNADVYTTEGGYFNEDQTAFLGFDELNRTYDLTFEFEDIQGGHVLALFYYWFMYMAMLKRGRVFAYAEDIDKRRLCYTCSIYRFLMDPSKQVLVGWSKATGCFPKSVPIGALFNINSGEIQVSSAQRFSIPFAVNKIEYNRPFILTDFNILCKRFNKEIDDPDKHLLAPINDPSYNFVGRPYILSRNGAHRLVWYYDPKEEPGNAAQLAIKKARLLIDAQNSGILYT